LLAAVVDQKQGDLARLLIKWSPKQQIWDASLSIHSSRKLGALAAFTNTQLIEAFHRFKCLWRTFGKKNGSTVHSV